MTRENTTKSYEETQNIIREHIRHRAIYNMHFEFGLIYMGVIYSIIIHTFFDYIQLIYVFTICPLLYVVSVFIYATKRYRNTVRKERLITSDLITLHYEIINKWNTK